MSHEAGTRTGREKLVYMANQIATFFESQPGEIAAEGIAKHINEFWEPRMRRQFFEIVDAGGPGLKPQVIEAAAAIRRPPAVPSPATQA